MGDKNLPKILCLDGEDLLLLAIFYLWFKGFRSFVNLLYQLFPSAHNHKSTVEAVDLNRPSKRYNDTFLRHNSATHPIEYDNKLRVGGSGAFDADEEKRHECGEDREDGGGNDLRKAVVRWR